LVRGSATHSENTKKQGQNKNQPEREILKNGENPDICKMWNKKQQCVNPEFSKNSSRQMWKRKRKSVKKTNKKPGTKALEQKPCMNW